MPLMEEFEASGRWLFRRRSYIPLVILVLVFASFGYFSYPFGSVLLDQIWEWFCLFVGFSGLIVRGLVAGYVPRQTSGRNTKQQVAETLNTTGMYSVVRNPLYLGNFLIGLAIALFLRVWWIPLIYLLSFMLYYERIIFAEEMFLRQKFGDELIWRGLPTHLHFFPSCLNGKDPPFPFSLPTLVLREYQSAYGLIMGLFALEQLTELYLGHGWHMDAMWIWIVGLATCGYLITRFLHKTGLLRVEGR